MSSNGNGEQGGDASDWGAARDRFDIVEKTRDKEVETQVDTFQDLGYALERDNLPDVVAADVAFNPFSIYGTTAEKGIAVAQAAVPGGAILGLGRMISMTDPAYFGPPVETDPNDGSLPDPPTGRPGQGAVGAKKPQARASGGVTPNPAVRASSKARKQTRSSNRGILTGASGVGGTAQVQKKTLLGS